MGSYTLLLSLLGTLVVSGSNFVVALPSVSPPNDRLSPEAPQLGSRAVLGDFQLVDGRVEVQTKPAACFPALDFIMPSQTPADLNNWWCDATDEYAFLGFSYEVEACE